MSDSTLFIPDITGFTKFVKSTDINHSKHIIEELINIIIDNGSEVFEVAEVEGDAVFFYKEKKVSTEEIIRVAKKIFVAFHSHLSYYEHGRICNCGACLQTIDLKLKFIIHTGEIGLAKFGGQKAKPYGDSVIAAHRLLKNKIGLNQYLLFSDDSLAESKLEFDGSGTLEDSSLGTIPFKYLKIDHWESDIISQVEHIADGKVDITVEADSSIPIDSDALYQYISDFRFRKFWNKEAEKVIFDENKINRVGTDHYCIINGEDLLFNTIKPKVGPNILAYGEILKNPKQLKYVETNFLMTPASIKETSLKFVIKVGVKWKVQLLMLPIIKRKLQKQAKHVLKSINDSLAVHGEELQKELA